MDILISSQDLRVIRLVQAQNATQVDSSGYTWGIRVDSVNDLRIHLAESAPGALGWIAPITDFDLIK